MPVQVAVGVDCADRGHVIHAQAPGVGKPLRLSITNDLAGFQKLLDELRQGFPGATFHSRWKTRLYWLPASSSRVISRSTP
jgi:hypothetical protein